MKIDTSIEAEFKTSLFDLFEKKLGVSVTTGFDWSHAGSKVYDSIVEIDVITTVQPGKFLKVQQAVGMVNDLAGFVQFFFWFVELPGRSPAFLFILSILTQTAFS